VLTKEEHSIKYLGSCEYCGGTLIAGDRECSGRGAPVPAVSTESKPVGYYYGQPIQSSGMFRAVRNDSHTIVTSGFPTL